MQLDRRQLLAAGGACLASPTFASLASLRSATGLAGAPGSDLDPLLAAHAGVLPEHAGAGANHYTMAAEALETLGYADALNPKWTEGAAGYAGDLPRAAPIEDEAGVDAALGDYGRFGDWLDFFALTIEQEGWRGVVAHWAPRLAPGMVGATFHGVIRAGHAARAVRRRASPERRRELAIGLAYWAARYTELPTRPARDGDTTAERSLETTLANLEYPYADTQESVGFFDVDRRLADPPLAPPVRPERDVAHPEAELAALVRDAATAFLEMLVLERYRIWLLHTVTGPACVDLLLPHVDAAGARELVAYARQAVVALWAGYGAPHSPRAHLRESPAEWPALIETTAEIAATSTSVHTVKLVEALKRYAHHDDRLFRSVAEQWLEWR